MSIILKACKFAAIKHKDQRRKNANADPYINHPIDVANILLDIGVTNENVLAAAILHDTIEDTKTTYDELIAQFGLNIAMIVYECTDDKSLSKTSRKQKQIEHGSRMSNSAKLVKLADKLSNLSTIVHDPPKDWTAAEIDGSITWSFAVCNAIYLSTDANSLEYLAIAALYKQLSVIFGDLVNMAPDLVKKKLEAYYERLRLSNP